MWALASAHLCGMGVPFPCPREVGAGGAVASPQWGGGFPAQGWVIFRCFEAPLGSELHVSAYMNSWGRQRLSQQQRVPGKPRQVPSVVPAPLPTDSLSPQTVRGPQHRLLYPSAKVGAGVTPPRFASPGERWAVDARGENDPGGAVPHATVLCRQCQELGDLSCLSYSAQAAGLPRAEGGGCRGGGGCSRAQLHTLALPQPQPWHQWAGACGNHGEYAPCSLIPHPVFCSPVSALPPVPEKLCLCYRQCAGRGSPGMRSPWVTLLVAICHGVTHIWLLVAEQSHELCPARR